MRELKQIQARLRFGLAALVCVMTFWSDGEAGTPSIQQVTNLQAVHRRGQTFLTWDALPGASITYRIYTSTTPLQSGSNLAGAKILGVIQDSSSFDRHLSDILAAPYFFRIDSVQAPLTISTEFFVRTVSNAAESYYAVTRVTGGSEDTTINPGGNATPVPLAEAPATPDAVWQMVLGSTTHVYVHWADSAGHTDYAPMANAPSIPFHFGLQKRGSAPRHPLVVRPHARGGHFLGAGGGTSNPEEWLLLLDDPIPNDIRNTIWHGYHTGFDLATGAGIPDTGIVVDYTTRRMVWTVEWVLGRFPIDTTRVYGSGGSMGGVGVVFLSMALPDRIAAIYATTPKFDFSIIDDPNPTNSYNTGGPEREDADRLWGTVNTNLPSSAGIPIYDRLNAGFLAKINKKKSLPVMVTFNGKNDAIVGWLEKIGFYKAMQDNRHGCIFFFDSRGHGYGTREWLPEQVPDLLYRYRLDQSYPAFSNALCNDNPGDGHATNGDVYGTINGHLEWDTDIVDSAGRYEITIRLVNLTSIYGNEAAPESTRVDVTPRRLQKFDVNAYPAFDYKNLDSSGAIVGQGTVAPDTSGLLTIPGVFVSRSGNRIVIAPSPLPPPPDTLDVSVTSGWNIVSIPLAPVHPEKSLLFPEASSPAYAYSAGYEERDSLQWGIGYWLKFPADGGVKIAGSTNIPDTLFVNQGWNLVGARNETISVSSILEIPAGIIGTAFFHYEGGYQASDSLFPGRGYWVKVNSNGSLVLPPPPP